MPTKKRQSKTDGGHPPCPVARARLRAVYEQWQAEERQAGRGASLTGFALALGYESHSAVGDVLNGKRGVSADMLRAARQRWDINPDWLLGFDGPKFAYEVLEAGTLEVMLAERVCAEVAARVAQEPVVGVLTIATGPVLATEGSGARLLAFVVAAAERALRASYPVNEQRQAVGHAMIAAQQAMAVHRQGRGALARAVAILPEAFPAPSDVPMADAPPIQFSYRLTTTPRQR